MGCGTCSSGGGTPSGCGDKGHCASGGCNRLNVFDWLANIDYPDGVQQFNIVEVRFKGNRKDFFVNTAGLDLYNGQYVSVEATSGHDIGQVSLKGELVRLQMKKKNVDEKSPDLKKIYRIATDSDIAKLTEARERESEIMQRARQVIIDMKIDMKLSDVEFQGDKSKVTFYYTADERVDFRELIKKYAEEFRTRIEMRQIGARQESALLGGLGSCGRELCCSSWLTDFKSVSTSAARYQNLSLNPMKLAGQCGRLKCCLNYELDTYMDALKDFPNDARRLQTVIGNAELVKTDIFKKLMMYTYPTLSDNTIYALTVDKVKEIQEQNQRGEKPESLEYLAAQMAILLDDADEETEPDFESDLTDNLNRFDERKKKKKKKPNNNQNRPRPDQNAVATDGTAPRPANPNQNRPRPEVKATSADGTQVAKPANPNQNQNRDRNQQPRREDGRPPAPRREDNRNQQPRPEQQARKTAPNPMVQKPDAPNLNTTTEGGEQTGNPPRPKNNRNRNKNRRNFKKPGAEGGAPSGE